MKPLHVRLLFAVVVLAVPVQVVVREVVAEPYPGLYQPSFGGVPQRGSVATTREPQVTVAYQDGHRARVPWEDVLPESPRQDLALFRSAFLSASRARHPETVDLLVERLPARGGRPPVRMVVEWQDVEYDLRTGERTVADVWRVVEVDLAGGS